MPARATPLQAKTLARSNKSIFICPSCSIWRLSSDVVRRRRAPRKRHASTLASSTAVNATKAIPSPYKELYGDLNELKKKAFPFVNLSRLQLAIQGLESETPTTRVAVLGLDISETARRLVRLLLADALAPEGRWENQLLSDDADHAHGVLIRHGQPPNPNLPQPKSVLTTLLIPAPVLERNRIEILVSAVSASIGRDTTRIDLRTTSDIFLSPTVGTPSHASGRQSMINQPVHKALVATKDVDELVRALELLSATRFGSPKEEQMVQIAANIEGKPEGMHGEILVFDASKAESGLKAVRSSLGNGEMYEQDWLKSGMPSISSWFTLASATNKPGLPEPIKSLIISLLDAGSSSIEAQAVESSMSPVQSRISENTRQTLEIAITEFVSQAHRELQSGLAAAWSSRNWRKLAWYKLFWRVDDVPLIITDLVNNAWLAQTEKQVYEIAGRLLQAGIPLSDFEAMPPATQAVPVKAPLKVQEPLNAYQPLMESGNITEATLQPESEVILEQKDHPIKPSLGFAISIARRKYITDAINSLTSSAQQIVLKAVGISSLTAGLSGLAYFSVTSGSTYESATIVALGTAYAMQRMQREWDTQCKGLEEGLMIAGRTVLKDTEEQMRLLVKGGRVVEDDIEARTRGEAAKAIEKTRSALSKIQ